MTDNVQGRQPKNGDTLNASEAACKMLTLHLREVDILHRRVRDFGRALCKKPVQNFVPGRKPPKLQGEMHLQNFVPLADLLVLNSCPTFIELLSNRVSYVATEVVDVKLHPPNSECSICNLNLGRLLLRRHLRTSDLLG